MSSAFVVIESITKWEWPGWHVRVWRTESVVKREYPENNDIVVTCRDTLLRKSVGGPDPYYFRDDGPADELIDQLMVNLRNLPRVTAAEVMRSHASNNSGVVVYFEWP